jgi:selenocysteine lyase/cysteine desulfurase
MLDRRNFLSSAAVMTGALAFRTRLLAQAAATPMPAPSLYDQNEDAYWGEIRKQFLIPADEVYLNNGTNGSCPLPVINAVFEGYRTTERMDQADPEDYPIWGYGPWNEFRDPVAQFVGATRDEIALVRNSTEANNFMINGFDMKAGEEALISDQEHPSGFSPWNLKAKRYGVVVKTFEIPKPPKSPADVLNRINDAITPRTRAIFVSHMTTTTGVVLPVKEICALARSKGIVSMIDGAQVTGQMPLNIPDLGCDMYGSSPHKWLMAPKGSGYLYVRNEIQDRIWSTVTTAGWDDTKSRAARFQQFGSSNVPMLWGLRAAIQFANQLGMDRITKRGRELADYIHAEMLKRGAESWTSPDPTLRNAIVTMNIPPVDVKDLEYTLWRTHKIRIRGGGNRIRLSTPYYLSKADIDRFLEKFDEYKKAKAGRGVAQVTWSGPQNLPEDV